MVNTQDMVILLTARGSSIVVRCVTMAHQFGLGPNSESGVRMVFPFLGINEQLATEPSASKVGFRPSKVGFRLYTPRCKHQHVRD